MPDLPIIRVQREFSVKRTITGEELWIIIYSRKANMATPGAKNEKKRKININYG